MFETRLTGEKPTAEILRFPLHKEETEPAKEGAADYFKTLSLMAKLFLEMEKRRNNR